LNNNIEDR